jgi:cytochrome c oxidase subunit II
MTFSIDSGRCGKLAAAAVMMATPAIALAEWGLNLTRGVTPYSNTVYDLHMLILAICAVIALVVFGVMFYTMFAFRKSNGAQAAQWHESTKVEFIWTIVPFVILVCIAVPATRALIMMEDVSGADMTIKITGYQWKWQYEYIDNGVSFFSTITQEANVARQLGSGIDPATIDHYLRDVDKRLIVPVGKKIRYLTTAADVIHAWWVPALGWKRDAIPGFINESWALIEEPGVYRGQCAELCGKDHGFMPIVVEALSEEDYATWVEGMQAAQADAGQSRTPVATAVVDREEGRDTRI